MANQKLKAKKKKARERESKATVIKRRLAKRKKEKERREWEEKMEEESGTKPTKLQPYVSPEKRKQWEEERQAQAKEQIEHNLEILKALEEQYLKDQKARDDLNERLEGEGYTSLEEKVKALGEKAQAQAEELAREDG